MSIFSNLSRFAQSRKGRELMGKAKRHAQSPEGRRQIEQVRQKVTERGRKGKVR